MFTGIIEEIGAISRRSGADLAVMAEKILDGLEIGDSVAINGVCLTVASLNNDNFTVQVSPESVERTTLAKLRPGDAVNLERAMAAGDRFGGHFVLGHVDGVGKVSSIQKQGKFSLWRFNAPTEVTRYIVPKGSIAVEGISLTVIEPTGDSFGVAIIPTTIEHTILKNKRPGDAVNIEADVIGRHIYHFMNGKSNNSITMDFLAKNDFL